MFSLGCCHFFTDLGTYASHVDGCQTCDFEPIFSLGKTEGGTRVEDEAGVETGVVIGDVVDGEIVITEGGGDDTEEICADGRADDDDDIT